VHGCKSGTTVYSEFERLASRVTAKEETNVQQQCELPWSLT
jgi:hypothetical protein